MYWVLPTDLAVPNLAHLKYKLSNTNNSPLHKVT